MTESTGQYKDVLEGIEANLEEISGTLVRIAEIMMQQGEDSKQVSLEAISTIQQMLDAPEEGDEDSDTWEPC